MGKKKYYLIGTIIFIFFVCMNYYSSFPSHAHRALLDLGIKPSFFEEQVRKGDVLPKQMVKEICDERKLRFLVIGGSIAAGAGLGEDEKAYPSLLCNADRIAGPNLKIKDLIPCIPKVVGENIYDAVILDMFNLSDVTKLILTKTLKNRFPLATIIDMREWLPCYLGFQHRKGWVPIQTWAKFLGYESLHDAAFLQAFKDSDRPWAVKYGNGMEKIFEENLQTNHIWSMIKDRDETLNEKGEYWKKAFLRREWQFSDWCVPNADGHKDIARGVLGMMLYDKTETSRADVVNPFDNDNGECTAF